MMQMNNAVFLTYRTEAKFENRKRSVTVELIRVTSDYYFLSPYQMSDFPKEREK